MYDFAGWATRNDLKCSDGRIIRKDAFKNQDGETVPLVWNHNHTNIDDVLGLAHLENRSDGVYAYCEFNNSENGQKAKELVRHGDVRSLSIFANKLKQVGNEVKHGVIKELSLVLAGANPGAFIDDVMAHGDTEENGMIIGYDENIVLYHSDEAEPKNDKKTVEDVLDSLNEEQQTVVYSIIGALLDGNDEEDDDEDDDNEDDHETESEKNMKHNLFEGGAEKETNYLSHADQKSIIELAKSNSVGSLQDAIGIYKEENKLAHGFDTIDTLFPDFKDLNPGAPELIQRDQDWVARVMQKARKSPFTRIRTRQADIRDDSIRAFGYVKGQKKNVPGNIKLLKRTTDPQTIYRKDALNRDDIIDIVDFDVAAYQYNIMRQNLNEEVAIAIMIGDGREDGDPNKIAQEHVRSIWNDDDLYTLHTDVDIAKAKTELQGSNTSANFGDNYVYAEAIIQAALYAREDYKGSGTPDFYCTPHLLNVMLLARDLNGRRIYDSKSDLARALNVADIFTAEQFEGKVRTDSKGKKHKLLGIFVNMEDYTIGSTKGGEITGFNQFDIDFNQEKYLIETRISAALSKVYSAIALEEPVETASDSHTETE
jgi:hypothetical protein